MISKEYDVIQNSEELYLSQCLQDANKTLQTERLLNSQYFRSSLSREVKSKIIALGNRMSSGIYPWFLYNYLEEVPNKQNPVSFIF